MKKRDNKKTDRQRKLFDSFRKPDGELDLAELAKYLLNARGGTELFVISKWTEECEIKEEYGVLFGQLVVELFSLVFRANFEGDNGIDELARLQLKAIEKIARPVKYELTFTDIEELATRDKARPAIARAMELRAIMSNLAWVVAPVKEGNGGVNQVIKLKTGQPPKHLEETHRLAEKHWKPRTTLQALAIRVYLERLQSEGIINGGEKGIDEKSLKSDLAEAQRWEATHLDIPHWQMRSLSEMPIRVYEYSQRWKQMRVKRNGKGEG